MLPQERMENIKAALFDYLETNWTATSKELQGETALDTADATLTEWVWFGVIGESGRHFVRHTDGNNLGELVNYILECLINVKPTANILRIDALRDTLVGLLRRVVIPVTDVAGGTNANIGNLTSNGILASQPLGMENDVNRHSLLFTFRWLEQFSPYTS